MNKKKFVKTVVFGVLLLSGCRGRTLTDEIVSVFERHGWEKIEGNKAREILAGRGAEGLKSLDKYAAIVSPAQAGAAAERSSGQKTGLGVLLASSGGMPCVSEVSPGSPAFEAGVRPGDCLLKINGVPMRGVPVARAAGLISGASGETVSLVLERASGEKKENVGLSVARRPFSVPSVWSYRGGGPSGYLRISSFSSGSSYAAKKELLDMSASGMGSLVLDLRYNPGGSLDEIVNFLNLFVGEGNILIKTVSAQQGYNADFRSGGSAPFGRLKVAVLVNGETMSGAEAAAVSLRENIGASLVGAETAGMAAIQKVFRLSDGTGLRLTVCALASPSGMKIEGNGITPDVIAPMSESQTLALKRTWLRHPGILPADDPCYISAVKILAARQ